MDRLFSKERLEDICVYIDGKKRWGGGGGGRGRSHKGPITIIIYVFPL